MCIRDSSHFIFTSDSPMFLPIVYGTEDVCPIDCQNILLGVTRWRGKGISELISLEVCIANMLHRGWTRFFCKNDHIIWNYCHNQHRNLLKHHFGISHYQYFQWFQFRIAKKWDSKSRISTRFCSVCLLLGSHVNAIYCWIFQSFEWIENYENVAIICCKLSLN